MEPVLDVTDLSVELSISGTWVRARHGYHYRPHRWIERNGGWYLDRGRWDRDGDGIPDRIDRHPNNPYRP